ncbi:MAG: DUF4907 domain-containing protein [Labilibaculum antarcticum]
MVKKKYFYLILIITGIFIISAYLFRNNKSTPPYTMQTYQTEEGWGYQILKNNKPIINQYRIPAIQEKHAFPSEKSAKIVGERVLKKIQLKEIPSISTDELMDLMIIDSLQQPLIIE